MLKLLNNFSYQRKLNPEVVLTGLLFMATWAYLWARAACVPILHDESATFFSYIQTGEFLPFHSFADANNHFLNSLLSYLSYSLFGSGILALRLPNLLSWPLYFFSVYFLSKQIRRPLLRWVLLLSLLLAHHFIEFFGLCRGYGLSMAFLLATLLFLYKTLTYKRTKDFLLCLLMNALAFSANLTLVFTFTFIIVCLSIFTFIEKNNRKGYWWRNISLIIFGGLPLLYFGTWILYLRSESLLYYTSMDGFFKATPGTLGTMLTGLPNLPAALIFSLCIFIVIILIIKILIIKSFKAFFESPMIFSVLLFGNLILIYLGHAVFDIHFPEDRTAMFLFPLLVLSIVFLADNYNLGFLRKPVYGFVMLLLFFPLHFLWSVNVKRSSLWYQEGIPQRFYTTILEQSEQNKTLPGIGGYILRHFTWGYVNLRHGGYLPQIKNSNYPEMVEDFQIVHLDRKIPWLTAYSGIDFDTSSGLSLLKRKTPLPRTKVLSIKAVPWANEPTSGEYLSFYEGNMDTLQASNLWVEISCKLVTEDAPFMGLLVATVQDTAGRQLAYEAIDIQWLRESWKEKDKPLKQGILLTSLPPDAARLLVYLYNKKKSVLTLSQPEVSVYKL